MYRVFIVIWPEFYMTSLDCFVLFLFRPLCDYVPYVNISWRKFGLSSSGVNIPEAVFGLMTSFGHIALDCSIVVENNVC